MKNPDIIYIKGLPYQSNLLVASKNNLKIHIIKFTYCNHKFSLKTITTKIEKFQPLMDNITNRRWNVGSLIVIIAATNAFIYISSMKIIKRV